MSYFNYFKPKSVKLLFTIGGRNENKDKDEYIDEVAGEGHLLRVTRHCLSSPFNRTMTFSWRLSKN